MTPIPKADPAAVAPELLAKMLSAAGLGRISAEDIRADVAAGAPVNEDGTLNLLHYAAWLAREDALGGRPS